MLWQESGVNNNFHHTNGFSQLTQLSILMPAYNESQHIYDNVLQTCATCNNEDVEVVVIDDGSQDKTFEEASAATHIDGRIRVLKLEKNGGKGAALAKGFDLAQGKFVAFLDADLEIQPDYVVKMLAALESSGKDVIVGRKVYLHARVPLLRRVMSRVYRRYVQLLFNLQLRDTQTGIKVFRRQVLETCMPELTVKGFAFDVELLALAQQAGYQIEEFPVELTFKRTRSLERIKAIHILRMFVDTLKIYFRLQKVKG